MLSFETHTAVLRNRRLSYLSWGDADAPTMVLLHGWMDVAASFQFLVDALKRRWRVLALDQRGYGGSEWTREPASGYWFADYIADLDAFLASVSPTSSVHLLGHSMGGNVACAYAGLRPHRVKALVSLDGFGMPAMPAAQAASQYRHWLDAILTEPKLSSYHSIDAVAARLQKNNPRLHQARADWLAKHWAQQGPDGRWYVRADPAHKLPFPFVYRIEESLAIWNEVTAPTLWIGGGESPAKEWNGYSEQTTVPETKTGHALEAFETRLAAFRDMRFHVVKEAGHMLHHDAPEQVATLIETHFGKN
jgi:pimeloyl-ACP methyl ester carboxylesterase